MGVTVARKHDDYEAARLAVIEAEADLADAIREHGKAEPNGAGEHPAVAAGRAALAAAGEALRAAEGPLAAEIDAAWAANRQAVGDAKDALRLALRAQSDVEFQCGNAARDRFARSGHRGLIVLTGDEVSLVTAARERTATARAAHEEAKDRFKAGVTVEQLEA